MSELEFTGERFVTDYDSPQISYEHWHRYCYAAQWVAGKKVLDIACGAGYGSALLAQTAAEVMGVDISPEAVTHARAAYPLANLQFVVGQASAIPDSGQELFDVVVSFETIEHVDQSTQQAFLKEIKRVLKPEGMLIISTPNKLVYSDLPKYHNEFHVKEFYFREFKTFLQQYFKETAFLGQRVYAGSHIWPLEQKTDKPAVEFHLNFDQTLKPVQQPKSDLYDLAICSDQPLPATAPSTMVDLSDRLMQLKDRSIGELQALLLQKEQVIRQLQDALQQRPEPQNLPAGNAPVQAPKVSIVIPVFNQVEYTQQCLEALAGHTPGELFELIVVDNASTDQTGMLLNALEGDVKIVRNQENQGFVLACNQGAALAGGEYILFLNNDTIPQPGWLEAMVDLADQDSSIGAVGAKLIYPNGKLQEAGGLIFKDGSGWNFGRLDDPNKTAYNEACQVDYCSGAALMVRAELFQELGGFDQRFAPAYYEDTDLCFGLRALGYVVMFCPQAAVVHCEGITAGTDLAQGFKHYQVVNRSKFVEKWADALALQEEPPSLTKLLPTTADRVKRGLAQPLQPVHTTVTTGPVNVLVIDPILPRYDRASGSLRLFNILKILRALDCQVTYIARNGVRQEQYKRELEAMGITVYATDPEKMAALGCPLEAEPINLKAILQATPFHLAWLSFYDIAEQYLAEIRQWSPQTTVMIDTVDVHFLREERQAALANDPQLAAKAKLTKQRELAIYQQADWLMTVTPDDQAVLHEVLPDKEIVVLPNIHGQQPDGPGFSERRDLLFVGNFHHPPNGDAMVYFCREVLPKVQRQWPEVKLTIVGDSPPPEVKALANDRVTVTGYVLETEPYLNAHRLSVAPLRYGAGMKGKIGEALSHGLPVVTTSIGSEGMGLIDSEQVLIADDPQSMADAIGRLYQDQALWEKLAYNGKAYIEDHFGFTAVTRIMTGLLGRLGARRGTSSGLVSIIILAHNQLEYTQRCVESIFQHTDEPYELIMVDNHSTDGTAAYLATLNNLKPLSCCGITLLSNQANLGFSAGNNQGLAAARGDFMLLLNNDTVVTDGWLATMLRVMAEKPQIGIVGPMSNYVSGPQLVRAVGYDVNSLRGLGEYAANFSHRRQGEARPFWRVVGFCMLIKREVIDAIGGFDDRYGLGNFEDDDFSLRAALAGFESWIAGDSYVHHFGSRTFAGARLDYDQSLRQNWEIFKRKWSIPLEVGYGEPYEMNTLIEQRFVECHYCPLPDVAAVGGNL